MCLIIYKPAGLKLPKQDVLFRAFFQNPNGAGIATRLEDGRIFYSKGHMIFEDLEYSLSRLYRKNRELMIHFRLASSGVVNEYNTHPFVLSTNLSDFEKLEGYATNGLLAHNGTRNLTLFPEPERFFRSKGFNDTARLAYLYSFLAEKGLNLDERLIIIKNLISIDRIIIFERKKTIRLGSWTEKGGLFYSNSLIFFEEKTKNEKKYDLDWWRWRDDDLMF